MVGKRAIVLTLSEAFASRGAGITLNIAASIAAFEVPSSSSRASLLFPAAPKAFKLPGKRQTYFVGFFVTDSPLAAFRQLNTKDRRSLLYSLGLASIVCITPTRNELLSIAARLRPRTLGFEIWRVERGKIAKITVKPPTTPRRELKNLRRLANRARSQTVAWLLLELALNLERFAELSEKYNPQGWAEIRELTDEVADVGKSLLAGVQHDVLAANRRGAAPSKKQIAAAMQSKREWDSQLDYLIQMNSALVYATTQAFHGALPSDATRSLISPYSLLGTGTAWRAIFRLYQAVRGIFQQHSIRLLLKQCDSDLGFIDPDELLTEEVLARVKRKFATSRNRKDREHVGPKVVHFSARFGFGEHDASLTCPAQLLHECENPVWSVVTMSHELLHAHVHDIFALLFMRGTAHSEVDSAAGDISVATAIFERYRDFCDARRGDRLTFLDSLCFAVIEYALEYRNLLDTFNRRYSTATGDFQPLRVWTVGVSLPTVAVCIQAYQDAIRFIEEIIVHTLDLIYFYAGDAEFFVDSLWYTWSTVPSVIHRLDWYILRTLLAVGAKKDGDPFTRLDYAIHVFRDRLEKMRARGHGVTVASAVLHNLRRDPSLKSWLELMYPPTLKLVDISRGFFFNPRVAGAIRSSGDRLVSADETGWKYLLEADTFDEEAVLNPIAFAFGRLTETLGSDRLPSVIEMARRSAWDFMAASSAQPKR